MNATETPAEYRRRHDWEGPVPKVIHVFGVEIVTDSELDTTQ